jgi:hypothetical protein
VLTIFIYIVAKLLQNSTNYKDTHRNKPESYFFGLLAIMGVLLIVYAISIGVSKA